MGCALRRASFLAAISRRPESLDSLHRVASVVTIAVIEPGAASEAILACLSDKFGQIDVVDIREYQVEVSGKQIAEAIKTVTEAAGQCDPDWHRVVAIAAPPGPG